MIMTTTDSIQGREIREHIAILSSEVVMGANFVRDFVASITDFIGGRSGTYESKLADARRTALNELRLRAIGQGADAVVGISLDYESVGKMLMVSATGTAVKLK